MVACLPGAVLGPIGAPGVIVASVFLATVGFFGVRGARVSVELAADTLVVRNVLRTKRIPASSIRSLRWQHAWTLNARVPVADLRRQRRPVWLYGAATFGTFAGQPSEREAAALAPGEVVRSPSRAP